MKFNLMPITAAAFIAATPLTSAQAADLDPVAEVAQTNRFDFYASLYGGVNIDVGNTDFTNGLTTVETDFDTGFQFGGALGYKWNNYNLGGLTPRTEIEVNYFDRNVGALNFSGNGPAPEVVIDDSQVSGVGVLGNVYLDWTNAFDSGLTPYVGGGIGVSFVNNNIIYNGAALNLNDQDTAFTWQVGAGVSHEITENASVFVDARYQQILNVDSLRRVGGVAAGGAGGGIFEDDVDSVLVRTGISIGF